MKLPVTLFSQRNLTIVATFALALLSGHWMQSFALRDSTPPQTPNAFPVPPATPTGFRTPPVLSERIRETRSPRSAGCAPKMQVDDMMDGSLRVSLSAPCHGSEPLRVSLDALSADVEIAANGVWEARLPQLASTSVVGLEFGDFSLSHSVSNEAHEAMQHVILQWTGPRSFGVKALVRGSATDKPLEQGMVTQLGNGDGAGFEIFSYPAGKGGQSGIVRLSAEAAVTAENCGKTTSMTAYQTGFLAGLRPTEIFYTMPDCTRIGETVSLQNLFRDMRLASR